MSPSSRVLSTIVVMVVTVVAASAARAEAPEVLPEAFQGTRCSHKPWKKEFETPCTYAALVIDGSSFLFQSGEYSKDSGSHIFDGSYVVESGAGTEADPFSLVLTIAKGYPGSHGYDDQPKAGDVLAVTIFAKGSTVGGTIEGHGSFQVTKKGKCVAAITSDTWKKVSDTWPPIDRACTTDADCAAYNGYLTDDGSCCWSCTYSVVSKAYLAKAEAFCAAKPHEGCPQKKCAAPPVVQCIDGICTDTKK